MASLIPYPVSLLQEDCSLPLGLYINFRVKLSLMFSSKVSQFSPDTYYTSLSSLFFQAFVTYMISKVHFLTYWEKNCKWLFFTDFVSRNFTILFINSNNLSVDYFESSTKIVISSADNTCFFLSKYYTFFLLTVLGPLAKCWVSVHYLIFFLMLKASKLHH